MQLKLENCKLRSDFLCPAQVLPDCRSSSDSCSSFITSSSSPSEKITSTWRTRSVTLTPAALTVKVHSDENPLILSSLHADRKQYHKVSSAEERFVFVLRLRLTLTPAPDALNFSPSDFSRAVLK